MSLAYNSLVVCAVLDVLDVHMTQPNQMRDQWNVLGRTWDLSARGSTGLLDAALSIAVSHCVVSIATVWSRSGSWSGRRRHGRSEGGDGGEGWEGMEGREGDERKGGGKGGKEAGMREEMAQESQEGTVQTIMHTVYVP